MFLQVPACQVTRWAGGAQVPLEQPLQHTRCMTEERSRTPFRFPSNRYENATNNNCLEPTAPTPVQGRCLSCKAARKYVLEQRASASTPVSQLPADRGWDWGHSPAGGFSGPPCPLCPMQEHRPALEGEYGSCMHHVSYICSFYHR